MTYKRNTDHNSNAIGTCAIHFQVMRSFFNAIGTCAIHFQVMRSFFISLVVEENNRRRMILFSLSHAIY